jgi:hypothetical protein
MTDIRKFAVEQTGRLHLRDATDELMYTDDAKTQAIAVNLYGPASKQYAKAQAEQNNRIVAKLKRKGKFDQSADQSAAERVEFLADCTASFENLDYDALTGPDLARAVYGDQTLGFIADQVAKHIGDWANFTSSSAKS